MPQIKKMTRKHKTKVSLIAHDLIKRDENGRYIPYCDFNVHRGISRTPELCEERTCIYYRRLYIK